MNTRGEPAEVILPVQKQLEAYNAKDIDAFMAWWAEDCQYYEFPSRLLASGAVAIRDRHITRFKEPNLFAALIRRIAVANVVVDQETVTRTFPEGPGEVDVVAIYEVEDGKISKAWFKMGPPRLHPPAAVALRPGTADDADAIRALTREAYARWVPIIGREPMPMTVDYHEAGRAESPHRPPAHRWKAGGAHRDDTGGRSPAHRERRGISGFSGKRLRSEANGSCRASGRDFGTFDNKALHQQVVRFEHTPVQKTGIWN
jgi:hypothetical protein